MSISFVASDSQLVVTCPEKFNSAAAALVTKEVTAQSNAVTGVTLNFKQTTKFETLVLLRCIGFLGKFLRSKNKTFLATNVSPELATEIRLNGLDSTIRFVAETIANVQPATKQGFNVEFINPFISSTIKTMQTQCGMELKPSDKPFLKGSRELPLIDIAGIIGLTSKSFQGSISICFPKKTFLGVMEGMLGELLPEITDDLQDGAGELLNIIFGQSKVIWNEKGFAIEKAIPTVVRATELKVRQYSSSPPLVLMFDSTRGQFYIEIALEQ